MTKLLRRQADEFVDLVHLIAKIGRDPGERQVRPAGERSRENADRPRENADRPARPNAALESRYGIRQGANGEDAPAQD